MSAYKRKASYQSGPMSSSKKRKKSPKIVPGITRKSGYYGRYPAGGGELKFYDIDVDDGTVTQGGTIQNSGSVVNIAQGTGESQRVGRKCTIKSIHWRYAITLPESDAIANPPSGDTIRVILYIDKQCNGTTAATTDIMESNDWQSFRNLANSGRFQILFDKTHSLNYMGLASDGAGVVSAPDRRLDFSFNKKCYVPLEFNSTTGVISELRSNNIGVLLMSRVGTIGFNSKMRFRYSD